MEDQAKSQPVGSGHEPTMPQPQQTARPRWSPKPEQILILESIFNCGTVNPTKDETVKIQKLLGRYGPVADANVFYWFQNRRSRSRRRLRQIRAAAAQEPPPSTTGGGRSYDGGNNNKNTNDSNNNNTVIQYEDFLGGGFGPNTGSMGSISLPVDGNESQGYGGGGNILHGDFSAGGSGLSLNPYDVNASSSSNGGRENNGSDNFFFSLSGHTTARFQDYEQNLYAGMGDLNYEPDVMTVFINGVATEVGRGPLNVKAMFNGDFVMYHGTGVPVEVNEYGYIVHSLQHGQNYFLVPRHS